MTPNKHVLTEFDPEQFTQILNGPATYHIEYRRARPCPCQDTLRSGPDQRCPVCRGRGSYWDSGAVDAAPPVTVELCRASLNDDERISPPPMTVLAVTGEDGQPIPAGGLSFALDGAAQWDEALPHPADYDLYRVTFQPGGVLRALVQNVTSRREFQQRGEIELTDLQITVDRYQADGVTPNPAWDAGEADRIILLDTWRRHASHLTRSEDGDTDDLTFRRARNYRVTSVRAGAIHVWTPGADYTPTDAGGLRWTPGRGPQPGEVYAVECEVSPEYYVFMELPQTRQISGRDLPRKFLLRGFEHFPNRKPA